MKYIQHLLTLSVLLITFFNASSQNLQWAKGMGGFDLDYCDGVMAIDDIYAFGRTESDFCYSGTDTFQKRGVEDLFLVKYDNNGSEKWIKQIGGTGFGHYGEFIFDIATDLNNQYIYITGVFTNNIYFDTVGLNGNGMDAFLAKYDSSSNLMWAIHAGGDSADGGNSLATDSFGNIYLIANFYGSGTIGGISVPEGDILAKFDSSGNCLWAKKIAKYAYFNMKLFGNDIFVAGVTKPNVDTVWIDTVAVLSDGSNNIILAKFDTSGNLSWFKKEGWSSYENCPDIAIDNMENIFICGNYKDSTIIQGDTLNSLHSFLAKYDSNGNSLWVKEHGVRNSSTYSSDCSSISIDLQNNIYIIGNASDTLIFENNIYPVGGYLARYNTNGDVIGVNHIHAEPRTVSVDLNNRPVICGFFGNYLSTASGDIQARGFVDGFVAMHDVITGIDEMERKKQNELLIYANPTLGKCNITIPDEWASGFHELTLTLFDERGLLLHSYPIAIKEGIIKLDLENEAKGIYFVTLSNGTKIYSGKIIFE